MQRIQISRFSKRGAPAAAGLLEVVIPFTSLEATQTAVRCAERLCSGMKASIRVVRVLIVPYPLSLEAPATPASFAAGEVESLCCDLPLTIDVRLCRDRIPGLLAAFGERPIVLLTSRKRWWRTTEEKLAAALKRVGHDVLLTYEESTVSRNRKRTNEEVTTCSM